MEKDNKQRSLWTETWRRFKKNKMAMIGLVFVIILVIIAISTTVIDIVTNQEFYEANIIQNISEKGGTTDFYPVLSYN